MALSPEVVKTLRDRINLFGTVKIQEKQRQKERAEAIQDALKKAVFSNVLGGSITPKPGVDLASMDYGDSPSVLGAFNPVKSRYYDILEKRILGDTNKGGIIPIEDAETEQEEADVLQEQTLGGTPTAENEQVKPAQDVDLSAIRDKLSGVKKFISGGKDLYGQMGRGVAEDIKPNIEKVLMRIKTMAPKAVKGARTSIVQKTGERVRAGGKSRLRAVQELKKANYPVTEANIQAVIKQLGE